MRFSAAYDLAKQALLSFIKDEALSRGAAIAYYTVTSIAPLLLIVIAVAGLFSGHEVAQAAITAQLSGLMGPQTARFLETAVTHASAESSSGWAMFAGIAALIATASGAFGEIQPALRLLNLLSPRCGSSPLIVAIAAPAHCESAITTSLDLGTWNLDLLVTFDDRTSHVTSDARAPSCQRCLGRGRLCVSTCVTKQLIERRRDSWSSAQKLGLKPRRKQRPEASRQLLAKPLALRPSLLLE